MYTPVKIHQLSATQKRKLRKGDKVIIRKGTGHTVFLSQEQKKKFDRACMKGQGLTVQFDPYQQDEHVGSGLFSSAKKLAMSKKNELVKIGKQRVRTGCSDCSLRRVYILAPPAPTLCFSKHRRRSTHGTETQFLQMTVLLLHQ